MTAQSTTWPRLPTLAARLAALDQAPVSSIWVDDQGIVGYSNRLFSEATGYSQEELAGSALECLLPSLTMERWRHDWWPLLEKEQQLPIFPLSWRHSKGVSLSYTATVSLVKVSGLQFAVFYLWPIPRRHDIAASDADNDATRLLQYLGENVCLLDEFGIIRFVNTAFCQLTAAHQADLLGMPLLELIAPEKSQLTKVWNVLNQSETSTDCEYKNLAGKIMHVRMTTVPLPDATENSASYIVSLVDITEQVKITRELAEQNASHERLAANIPGFIYKFRMTPEGEFSFPYASHGCKEIFGIDPCAVVDDATPIIHTIHPDDLPKFQSSVLNSAMHLSPWNFEARQKTSNGDWKWFHAASRPELQENGNIIWEGLVMDVTDRKKAEQDLAKAKQEAEILATAKTQFLANMSHEIRTPLNAIIGLNRLTLQTNLKPLQRDYLQKIQASSESLFAIINNILDFSKIESGKLDIEQLEFNLDTVLEHVGSLLEPAASEKNLQLSIDRSIDLPLLIRGDSLRLVQVLTNLCSNAIKFTSHGEVLITVRREQDDGSLPTLRFAVKDTGIGMSEQQQKKIFAAFTQADNSTTRNFGGTGLGLSISKRLVELMGGEIGVTSSEGRGSEFFFTLPLIPAAAARHDIVLPADLQYWQIALIMNDDCSNSILAKMLQDLQFGCSVYSLQNSSLEKILENIAKTQPAEKCLMLLDLSHADDHSTLLTKALESAGFGDETALIINISSLHDDLTDLSERFVNLAFLKKPCTPSMLIDAIAKATCIEGLLDVFHIENTADKASIHEPAVSGMRVLVVEDNDINQEVIRGTLENANVVVDIVGNGQEALDRLSPEGSENHYAAVLMDLQMPVMDGYEATSRLRKVKRLDGLPIIAMTAHASLADKEKCLAAGMQDHIGKPLDIEQLFSTLARWAGKASSALSNDPATSAVATGAGQITAESIQEILTTVDMQSALRMLQGDVEVLQRLLRQFAGEQGIARERIQLLVAEHDWQQAAAQVHQIKGIAGNLYISDIYNITVQLEKALSDRQRDLTDTLLDQYSEAFDRFVEQLEKWHDDPLPHHAASNETSLPDTDLNDTVLLLERLLTYLESNSWQAEDCLEQIRCRMNGLYAAELSAIGHCLINLEFSTAADQVRKLRDQLYFPV